MIGVSIEVRRKLYPAVGASPARLVYEAFDLTAAPGAFVCLLGPSGCGKTTLLNLVAGLDRAYEGGVSFPGAPPGAAPRIAYAFQSPRLLPWRTILDNVALPLPPGAASRARALALLTEMGLGPAADAYPGRLSLGQQRRAALARAFAVEPDLLLMDEPFVSLDERNADLLRDLLAGLLRRRPATVLFVTHDAREAVRLADRLVVIEGAPARIVRDLANPLGPDERRSEAAIEAVRREHLSPGPAGP